MYFQLSNRNMVYWILPKCHSLAQIGETIFCTFITVQGNSLSKKKNEGKVVFVSRTYMLSGKEKIQYLLQPPLTFLHSVF